MNIAVALVGITRCYPAMTASKGVENGLPLGGLAHNGDMTDEELKALVASLAVSQAKTDAQLAQTDAQTARATQQPQLASASC